jgi:two-component system, NtrC family, nitrogen regulation sensor histidine kinase NtrY
VKEILRRSSTRHAYLFVVAVWLYILSFLFSATWSYRSSPESIREKFEQYIKAGEQQFEKFAADKEAISDITREVASPAKAFKYLDEQTGFFIYTRNDIGNFLFNYWSTNKLAPQQSDLSLPDGKHLVIHSNGEFEFIKRTMVINDQSVIVAGLIPLRLKYFVSNRYLSTNFPALKNVGDNYEILTTGGTIKIRNGDGKVLFELEELKKTTTKSTGAWAIACKVLSVIFFLAFLNMLAYDVSVNKGWKIAVGLLAGVLLLLRLISYYLPFPFAYHKLDLFDPAIYASNSLHPSLGDLLINILIIFWLISFVKYTAVNKMKQQPNYYGKTSFWVCIIVSVLLVAISFTSAGIIRSLIVDSKISYDVANFFRLNVYTLISFIVLCFITLSFFNLSHLLLLHLYKCRDIPEYLPYLSVAMAGLFYLTINVQSAAMESNLVVVAWLLVFMLIMHFRRQDIYIPLVRSSFFLPWLIFFTACTSALIIYQSRSVDLEERKSYAYKLAEQSDPSAQTSLNIALNSFSNENFLASNFDRFKQELSNKSIKDSLINQNFQGYLNKYDTRIYTYDSNYNALFNEDPISFELVSNIITTQGKKTNLPGVFYFENAYDRFSYLYHKEVRNADSSVIGHIVIFADPKKYKSDAVFPELFRQSRDIAADYDINNAYAIYHNGRIIQNNGDYDFASVIPRDQYPRSDFVVKERRGFSEMWYNAGNNKILILVKSASVTFQSITLFAYLFGTYLFLIILFHFAVFLVRTRFTWSRIVLSLRMNFRKQIQTAIIFISLFSFIVIGVATISFYILRFRKTNRERLVKSITIMANEVNSQVASHAMFDDALRIYDLGPRSQLEKSINEIAEIHSIDVNFYDLTGNLVISTQPYIYRKQILSGMMEPRAFFSLHYQNKIQFIQDENVGQFKFLSIYVPIRDPQGNPYAYLNVPYLSSQVELNQEISNFLVTLINLNAFIFLFAGAISLLLTNRITRSFTLIADKMKQISLGAANEQVQWDADDEIGALVNEYNKMVKKLEQSAEALAKSEREGAWREMARQVAHEIKNPLTPMKLSIQYLQRSIQDKNPDIQVLSQKVAATLVEQIDQLAKIASDFSQFANIGQVQFERFDINEVIASLVDLYSTNERLQITWNRPGKPGIIDADRTQVNRLFTNLLQNAIEASSGKVIIPIEIVEQYNANKLQVTIIDHGAGIPVEKQSKIFTPNFTTKSSGTGLGLAICKGIVEKANGKLWFDTKEGKGTSFHVMFPMVALPS